MWLCCLRERRSRWHRIGSARRCGGVVACLASGAVGAGVVGLFLGVPYGVTPFDFRRVPVVLCL